MSWNGKQTVAKQTKKPVEETNTFLVSLVTHLHLGGGGGCILYNESQLILGSCCALVFTV